MLAFIGSRVGRVLRDTDSETELVGSHVVHPLLIRNVRTSRVSGDVTTDGVTKTSSTVGVKLTSLVTALNVKMGEVTETLDLPVEGSLDKVDGGKDTIRDDSGIVSGLDTPGDLLSLRLTNHRIGHGGSKKTEIVNGVKREQSGIRGLVDGSTKSRLRGVGGTHGTCGGDLSVDVGHTGHEGGSSADSNLGDHYE